MKLDAWIKLLVGLGWVGLAGSQIGGWVGWDTKVLVIAKNKCQLAFSLLGPWVVYVLVPQSCIFKNDKSKRYLLKYLPLILFCWRLRNLNVFCVAQGLKDKYVYIELDKRSLLFLDKEQMSSISGFCNVHRWIYINHSKILKLSTPRLLWSHACKNKVRKL